MYRFNNFSGFHYMGFYCSVDFLLSRFVIDRTRWKVVSTNFTRLVQLGWLLRFVPKQLVCSFFVNELHTLDLYLVLSLHSLQSRRCLMHLDLRVLLCFDFFKLFQWLLRIFRLQILLISHHLEHFVSPERHRPRAINHIFEFTLLNFLPCLLLFKSFRRSTRHLCV